MERDGKPNYYAAIDNCINRRIAEFLEDKETITQDALREVVTLARYSGVGSAKDKASLKHKWSIFFVFLTTLGIISFLIFAKIPETNVEIALNVAEVSWTTRVPQLQLEGLQLISIGASNVKHVNGYLSQPGNLPIELVTSEHPSAFRLAVATTDSMIAFGPMIVPAGSKLHLRSSSSGSNFNLSLLGKDIAVPINIRGRISVLSKEGKATVNTHDAPRICELVPWGEDISLELEKEPGVTWRFNNQLEIDDLSTTTVDEHISPTLSVVREQSTIRSGTIYFIDFLGLKYGLRPREVLLLEGVRGELATIALTDSGIALHFRGNVEDITVGWGERPRSLMPSWLEYLKSNHGLSLLWSAVIYVFGIAAGIYRWWRE